MPNIIENFKKDLLSKEGSALRIKTIGRGDTSTCYSYDDPNIGEVAITVIDLSKLKPGKEKLIQNNLNILFLLGRLRDFEADQSEESESCYIAQTKLGGENPQPLIELIYSKTPTDINRKIEITHKICQNLLELHNRHIIHGDLHAANILTNGDIVDFEYAIELNADETEKRSKRSEESKGEHVAPEWKDEKEGIASYSADIYSLGKLLSNSGDLLGFNLNQYEDYPSHITATEHQIIARYISQMCEDDRASRPPLEHVVNFFEKVKERVEDNSRQILSEELLYNKSAAIPIDDSASPTIKDDTSLMQKVNWRDFIPEDDQKFKFTKIETIQKGSNANYIGSIVNKEHPADSLVNIISDQLECPVQANLKGQQEQAEAITKVLAALVEQNKKEQTDRKKILTVEADQYFTVEHLNPILTILQEEKILVRFKCAAEASDEIKKIISDYNTKQFKKSPKKKP